MEYFTNEMIDKLLILRIARRGDAACLSRIRVHPRNPRLLLISRARPLRSMGKESRSPSRGRRRAGLASSSLPGKKRAPPTDRGELLIGGVAVFTRPFSGLLTSQNTGFSRKFRDAEKCFWILTIPRLNLPTDSGSMLMPSQPRYGVGESALARKSKSLGNCEIDLRILVAATQTLRMPLAELRKLNIR